MNQMYEDTSLDISFYSGFYFNGYQKMYEFINLSFPMPPLGVGQ